MRLVTRGSTQGPHQLTRSCASSSAARPLRHATDGHGEGLPRELRQTCRATCVHRSNGRHDDHEDLGARCSDEDQARLTTTKPRPDERTTHDDRLRE
jgi:hypothetical protein